MAEPSDLQKNISKDKNQTNWRDSGPEPLPSGRMKAGAPSFPISWCLEKRPSLAHGQHREEAKAAEPAWLLYIKVYYTGGIYCTGKNPLD